MALDPLVSSSLISTGGNFLGAALSKNGGSKDRAQARMFYQMDRQLQRKQFNKNIALQREFARKGIRYRVADAKAAGIHPLVAMGAQLAPYTPMQGGGSSYSSGGGYTGDTMADAVRASSAQIAQIVADRDESLSRTRLNNAQAAALEADLKMSAPGAPPHPQPPGLADHDIRKPQFTTGANAGFKIKSSPLFSDAQTYEDRYGELGGSILGLMNIPADLLNTVVQALSLDKAPPPRQGHYDPKYWRPY